MCTLQMACEVSGQGDLPYSDLAINILAVFAKKRGGERDEVAAGCFGGGGVVPFSFYHLLVVTGDLDNPCCGESARKPVVVNGAEYCLRLRMWWAWELLE